MTAKNKAIDAAAKLLEKKGAMTASQINSILKARGLRTLTSTELVNNFDKAAIKGNPKNKYAYTKKKTIVPVKEQAKAKPAKKPAKPAKKACKKACKADKKPCAKSCKEKADAIAKAVVDGMTAKGRYRTIELPGGTKVQVDILQFNNLAALSNCIGLNPDSVKCPSKWVFLAGRGEWPSVFRGIDVHVNQEATGVLLVKRSMLVPN